MCSNSGGWGKGARPEGTRCEGKVAQKYKFQVGGIVDLGSSSFWEGGGSSIMFCRMSRAGQMAASRLVAQPDDAPISAPTHTYDVPLTGGLC